MGVVYPQKVLINREEQMLGSEEQTPYNQIQDIGAMKEPYDKLWTAAVKFHAYHDKWMNGPLLEVTYHSLDEWPSPRGNVSQFG